jgi:gentisate 1,2-dioxygenase
MAAAITEASAPSRAALPSAARAAMERLNTEAEGLHIWLRTQANAPSQRSWFQGGGIEAGGQLAQGRVGANQMKAAPYRWRWREISPYLDRIAGIARNADVSPIEFADRQQFLLVNPGLGGRIQVASTIRCAVSIYNPGDVAPVHMHTPNASRTILSENGGYTTIEGERCEAARGDLILTPNGTWHDHGNDGATPVIWADILDFPLMEFLDCSWIDEDFPGERDGNARAQKPPLGQALWGGRDRAGVCLAPARHRPWHLAGVSLPRGRDPRGA